MAEYNSVARASGEVSDEIKVKKEVRQGDALQALLFTGSLNTAVTKLNEI